MSKRHFTLLPALTALTMVLAGFAVPAALAQQPAAPPSTAGETEPAQEEIPSRDRLVKALAEARAALEAATTEQDKAKAQQVIDAIEEQLEKGRSPGLRSFFFSQLDAARGQAERIGKKVLPGLAWILYALILCKVGSLIVRYIFSLSGLVSRSLRKWRMDLRRVDTITSLIESAFVYVIYFAGFLYVLRKLEVNTTPIIAAVTGMLAVGVGFGSQNLVRDLVSGLFLLMEGQLVVGDFIDAAGAVGFIEEVGIRTTRIREISGQVRVISNGRITTVRRFPRGYTEAQVDIFLASNEDVPKARRILEELGHKLDEELEVVLKVPELAGVMNEGQGDVFLRYVIRTVPTQEWVANTEFVSRVKAAFAAEDIALNNNMIRVVLMTDVEVFRSRLLRFRELIDQMTGKA